MMTSASRPERRASITSRCEDVTRKREQRVSQLRTARPCLPVAEGVEAPVPLEDRLGRRHHQSTSGPFPSRGRRYTQTNVYLSTLCICKDDGKKVQGCDGGN